MAFSLDDFFDQEPIVPVAKPASNPETPPWDESKDDELFPQAGITINQVTDETVIETEVLDSSVVKEVDETEVIEEQIRQCQSEIDSDIPAWKKAVLQSHLTNLHNRHLQSIINNEALEFAMYTVEERAIPSIVDGFKPVQRFFMYRALEYAKQNKTKFNKVAALAGGVSEAGYHHGEGSAAGAGQLIANTWNNNIPVLEGDGNFGSRLVQQAAAPRYVFCRVHQNFWDIYKDISLAPAHSDPEHMPPRFYLPVIPMVLANGVKGIATGYATTIFPHSYESLVKCTMAAVRGEEVPEPEVQFPCFKGIVRRINSKSIEIEGLYELVGQTKLVITEVPVRYDRLEYVSILDKLEEQGKIVGYKEQTSEGFKFEVTLKRQDKFGELMEKNPEVAHEKIIKMFNLRQNLSQNITVLDENGKLAEYDCAADLIRDFVEIRKKYTSQRVEFEKQKAEYARDLAWAKFAFINEVIEEKIVIRGKSKSDLIAEVKSKPNMTGFENELVGMSIYRLTEDESLKLQEEAIKQTKEFEYWTNTTPEIEYVNDLKSLKGK
ncbi:DNA topoisomerase subunit [Aeromonas phage vB_AsM_ZHF]|uniref:DNA topoisomerase subunit n=1 Tax=Aeromonas phage vB_AsM_ZHF TaxID=2812849 RepID=A0A898K9Q0_9CAUD|nr:DNA topoisomerase subunit [Aeromonas phage vB_AsM_ZHF]